VKKKFSGREWKLEKLVKSFAVSKDRVVLLPGKLLSSGKGQGVAWGKVAVTAWQGTCLEPDYDLRAFMETG